MSLRDAATLPWVEERVATVRKTRVGLEIVLGPFVGQLVVPDRLVLDVEETFPGTLRACLALSTGGRRAGEQPTRRGTVAVPAWNAVIDRFATDVIAYVRGGPEKRYLQRSTTTAHPRGRIDLARSATRVWSRGRTDLLVCDVRSLTEDTHLNRTLLAATVKAEALALQLGVDEAVRQLRVASSLLSGARLERAPNLAATRAEANPSLPHIQSLVALAEVVLNGIPALPPPSLEHAVFPMSAWLNVERIFEDAVRAVTAQAAPMATVRAGLGDGVLLLREIPGDPSPILHRADPDVVVSRGGRVAILDAKYRRHGDRYSEGELYQLIAHAHAYGAEAAALVAPAVHRSPGSYPIGRDSTGTEFYVIAVDPASELSFERHIGAWVTAWLNGGSVPA